MGLTGCLSPVSDVWPFAWPVMRVGLWTSGYKLLHVFHWGRGYVVRSPMQGGGLDRSVGLFNIMSTGRCARRVCIDVSTAVIPTSYGVYG